MNSAGNLGLNRRSFLAALAAAGAAGVQLGCGLFDGDTAFIVTVVCRRCLVGG